MGLAESPTKPSRFPHLLPMKNIFKLTTLMGLMSCGLSAPVAADESELPVSHVNGLVPLNVRASGVTHVGLPFTRVPVTTPREITAKTANTVTLAGSIPALTGPHSLQIVGGKADGLVLTIASISGSVITTSEPVPAAVKADLDRARIIPNWTLGTLFANGGGLTGGATAAAADKVAVESAGIVTEYYYNTTASQWQKTDDAGGSMNDVAIPLQGGVRVTRVAGADFDFVLSGVVRSGTQRARVRDAATTILCYPFAEAGVTLGNSGLADLVVPGADVASADEVIINGISYIHSVAGWRLASGGTASQNGVVIPPGGAVEIVRKAPTGTPFPRRWRGSRTLTSLRPKPAAKTDTWIVRERFPAQ